MNTKIAIFLIEGGKALELVKFHISERQRVNRSNTELMKELGPDVTQARTDRWTGVLRSVVFPGKVPDGWTVPDRDGCSRPKKGTHWAERFAAQVGHAFASDTIVTNFQVPTGIAYKQGASWGSRRIGNPFSLEPCGFLYLSANGPYAMWTPDVLAEVAEEVAAGNTVEEPAASFTFEFVGCRRIEQEEWDILVAQYQLAKKQQRAAEARHENT